VKINVLMYSLSLRCIRRFPPFWNSAFLSRRHFWAECQGYTNAVLTGSDCLPEIRAPDIYKIMQGFSSRPPLHSVDFHGTLSAFESKLVRQLTVSYCVRKRRFDNFRIGNQRGGRVLRVAYLSATARCPTSLEHFLPLVFSLGITRSRILKT